MDNISAQFLAKRLQLVHREIFQVVRELHLILYRASAMGLVRFQNTDAVAGHVVCWMTHCTSPALERARGIPHVHARLDGKCREKATQNGVQH